MSKTIKISKLQRIYYPDYHVTYSPGLYTVSDAEAEKLEGELVTDKGEFAPTPTGASPPSTSEPEPEVESNSPSY